GLVVWMHLNAAAAHLSMNLSLFWTKVVEALMRAVWQSTVRRGSATKRSPALALGADRTAREKTRIHATRIATSSDATALRGRRRATAPRGKRCATALPCKRRSNGRAAITRDSGAPRSAAGASDQCRNASLGGGKRARRRHIDAPTVDSVTARSEKG